MDDAAPLRIMAVLHQTSFRVQLLIEGHLRGLSMRFRTAGTVSLVITDIRNNPTCRDLESLSRGDVLK
jgi:hypothetical protein